MAGVYSTMHVSDGMGRVLIDEDPDKGFEFSINEMRVLFDADDKSILLELEDRDEREKYCGSYVNVFLKTPEEVELLIFRLQQELKRMRELDK